MFIQALGLNVFYERKTGKENPVLILHGWGCSASTMRCIFNYFAMLGHEVVAIDFPGFGRSDIPPSTFTIYDYARVTSEIIERLFSQKPHIVAHSFGGRVALILASQNKVNKLVLTGCAGMKPRRSIKYFVKVGVYKLKKKWGLSTKKFGSPDYRALNDDMKKVFVSVVNEHLEKLLPSIKCPTLLIWGARDKATPPYMARRMCSAIENCEIVMLKGSSHFAFLEEPKTFLLIAKAFLKGD